MATRRTLERVSLVGLGMFVGAALGVSGVVLTQNDSNPAEPAAEFASTLSPLAATAPDASPLGALTQPGETAETKTAQTAEPAEASSPWTASTRASDIVLTPSTIAAPSTTLGPPEIGVKSTSPEPPAPIDDSALDVAATGDLDFGLMVRVLDALSAPTSPAEPRLVPNDPIPNNTATDDTATDNTAGDGAGGDGATPNTGGVSDPANPASTSNNAAVTQSPPSTAPEQVTPAERPARVTGRIVEGSEIRVLNGLNVKRRWAGLPALTMDPEAQAEARRWSEQMSRDDNFNHRPDIRYNLPSAYSIGENIAVGGDISAIDLALYESEPHRLTMLNPDFTAIGVGVWWDRTTQRFWVTEILVS